MGAQHKYFWYDTVTSGGGVWKRQSDKAGIRTKSQNSGLGGARACGPTFRGRVSTPFTTWKCIAHSIIMYTLPLVQSLTAGYYIPDETILAMPSLMPSEQNFITVTHMG